MSLRKLKASLLLALAVFLLIMSIVLSLNASEAEAELRRAELVTDGSVYPENEGRKIILLLNTMAIRRAYDAEMGIQFDSSCIKRYVEEFRMIKVKNGKYQWGWRSVSEDQNLGYKSKSIIGNHQGQALMIDRDLLKELPSGRDCTLENMTIDRDYQKKMGVHVFQGDSITYLTNADDACFGKKMESNSDQTGVFAENAGKIRVFYRTIFESDKKVVALVGNQRGNMLMRDPNQKGKFFYTDITSVNSMIRQSRKRMLVKLSLFIVGAGVLGIVGMTLLKYGEKD